MLKTAESGTARRFRFDERQVEQSRVEQSLKRPLVECTEAEPLTLALSRSAGRGEERRGEHSREEYCRPSKTARWSIPCHTSHHTTPYNAIHGHGTTTTNTTNTTQHSRTRYSAGTTVDCTVLHCTALYRTISFLPTTTKLYSTLPPPTQSAPLLASRLCS